MNKRQGRSQGIAGPPRLLLLLRSLPIGREITKNRDRCVCYLTDIASKDVGPGFATLVGKSRMAAPMLKIERIQEKSGTRLLLSGELQNGYLEDVRIEVASTAPPVTLDLAEVERIDIDGIRLLNECQTQGARVTNCAPYIRAWMRQERHETKR